MLMVLLGGIELKLPKVSMFELERKTKNSKNDIQLKIVNNYHLFNTIKNFLYIMVVISFTGLLSVLVVGPKAYFISLGGVYVAYLISRVKYVRYFANKLTHKIQHKILYFINKHHKVLTYFILQKANEPDVKISSAQELGHIVKERADFLSEEQKKIIANGVNFYDTKVSAVMIERSQISTLKGSEVLGPVVLDKLYKSNQEYTLVIGKNIDEVKGVLFLKDLMQIESGGNSTKTAIKAARKPVQYIRGNATLGEALKAMLKSGDYSLVVVDKDDNTVGLVTLALVIGKLVA